ncbi:SOS response-associated peptidase [Allocoprobacillus halotolerans]|uniref:Abasic site processing protein n=1 Tax=Allocoprobacillus halotolerans TaxID=2944914 RepID=A0ABY5I6E5_9FIRM|nr:SOS response-associated peptidase family protein [Allocoprobacillus halotolerans]UTY40570.1 SOS response-associated peptidase [Allocoprobacillus halotolerans]
MEESGKGGEIMCGRFYIMRQIYLVLKDMGIDVKPEQILLGDCFPKQKIPVIVMEKGQYVVKNMQWGYHFPYDSRLVINARSETLLEKKMFQKDMKVRRCLIFARGFYEWDHQKHMLSFENEDDSIMMMAGLYNENKEVVIITKQANDVMRPIHSRMPVIIKPEHMHQWFDMTSSYFYFDAIESAIKIVNGSHQLSLFG